MKQGIEVELLRDGETERLKAVLGEDRFDPFRKYRMVPAEKRLELRFARLLKDQGEDREHNFILEILDERLLAFAALKRQPLASEVFGLNMGQAEIGCVHTGECHLEKLLEAVVSESRARNFEHLAVSVDASDTALLKAVQKNGFFLTSAQMTLLYDYRPSRPIKPVGRFSVRKFRPEDRQSVFEIARESFSKQMRLHRDPYLDADRVPELYLKWLDIIIRESGGEFGHVSLIRDEVVGFLIEHFDRSFFELTGVRKVGEALSGVRERGKGSYPALCSAALNGLKDKVDIHDAQCLLDNTEVIHALSAFDFQLVRTQYVMHRYLGERS